MTKYIVEFWPGKLIEVEASDEDDALFRAIEQVGCWPGGSESTSNGDQYRVWVREAK